MKKTLLLSVVASTLIMAGGDIEPVAAPVVETSNWEWSGTAKLYYQTMDHENYTINGAVNPNARVVGDSNDMFDRRSSAADAGLQLRVANKDVIGGLGFGAELTAINTLNLVNYGVVTASMQSVGADANAADADDILSGAWVSQAYLTYGFGNTSIKVGRQELPKSLSPFAFSEGWNIFKNTFEAALIVNTDLPDTTLVGAYVNRANGSRSWAGSIVAITNAHDMTDWADVGEDGAYMLTAQNKSIANLTLTGSFYYAPSFVKATDMDVTIFWADAKYNNADFPVTVAVQGGVLDYDAIGATDTQTTAFGARIGGKVGPIALSAAYTSVDMEANSISVTNLGTGVKSPLYTQQVLNQVFIDGHNGDADTWQIKGVYKGLGGKFVAQYANSDTENDWNYGEFDFIYGTTFNTAYGDLGLKAMWINQDFDGAPKAGVNSGDDTNNVIRLIASYDF
ncbi:hypothetical protein YH65_00645 [Sulfurovum lithotrophicum]|uniref:Porin n=1 Tax=Sulfurovum lithotrophicum TaxID=206403 RepID=A0A7U4RPX0_9BACT|nr:hypothetical protein [Sulfurovum lithotrophicum]AKF24081.1 hypothetical protein YH65_00645 [Sulfurovum lithotrophicum]